MEQNKRNESAAGHGGVSTPGQALDVESLWERVDHDTELLLELLTIFEQECPVMLQKLGAAIEQNSGVDVQKYSHKIKGSVLQFSAATAAAHANKLEEMGRNHSLDGAQELLGLLEHEISMLTATVHAMVRGESPAV